MEIYGNPWKSMEIYGNPWKSMETYGNLWLNMFELWKSVGIHGNFVFDHRTLVILNGFIHAKWWFNYRSNNMGLAQNLRPRGPQIFVSFSLLLQCEAPQ